MFNAIIVGCNENSFVDKKTGEPVVMYKVAARLSDGSIGFLSSKIPFEIGSEVELTLTVDYEYRFKVRIVDLEV